MIKNVCVIACDGCGLGLGEHDATEEWPVGAFIFGSAEESWETARDAGWRTTGHRHYCPGCWAEKHGAVAS